MMRSLKRKIQDRTAVVGIMGLGYVGLPLALAFSKEFKTIGFDVNAKIVDELSRGRSHIGDISDPEVDGVVGKSFHPTTDASRLAECDFVIVCVPTPLKENGEPDLAYLKSASALIADVLRKDMFVVIESTTYPGTTDGLIRSILEKKGLKAGKDFGLAFSPERIDPGSRYKVNQIPKIVGGIDDQSTSTALALYSTVIEKVYSVSDARTAEAVKMMENIFRNINIALVNEMALVFERMGIDSWEVIEAAKTKPFGFMAFYPGPGIGGHCIPLDPMYMSYASKRYEYAPRFIEMAAEINDFMRIHAVNLLEKGLAKAGRTLDGASVAVLGLAYKKNVGDARETPSSSIITEIRERGASVKAYDPFVRSLTTSSGVVSSEGSVEAAVKDADAAIILVDHDAFRDIDLKKLARGMRSPVIIDCKNLSGPMPGIIYVGLGKPESQD